MFALAVYIYFCCFKTDFYFWVTKLIPFSQFLPSFKIGITSFLHLKHARSFQISIYYQEFVFMLIKIYTNSESGNQGGYW